MTGGERVRQRHRDRRPFGDGVGRATRATAAVGYEDVKGPNIEREKDGRVRQKNGQDSRRRVQWY